MFQVLYMFGGEVLLLIVNSVLTKTLTLITTVT